jgi:hypothetical protein
MIVNESFGHVRIFLSPLSKPSSLSLNIFLVLSLLECDVFARGLADVKLAKDEANDDHPKKVEQPDHWWTLLKAHV